jgi:hypothetical protein
MKSKSENEILSIITAFVVTFLDLNNSFPPLYEEGNHIVEYYISIIVQTYE